jgi:hypothetical protein
MNENVEIEQSPVQSSNGTERSADPSAVAMGPFVGMFAAGVAVCFFLPWLNVLGFKVSGLDIVRKGEGVYFALCTIQFFGVVTLIGSLAKISIKPAAQLTAVIPFFVLIYALFKEGPDLLKLLDFGVYLGLFLAFATLMASTKLKS